MAGKQVGQVVLKGGKILVEAIVGAIIAKVAGEVADVVVEKGKDVAKKPMAKT